VRTRRLAPGSLDKLGHHHHGEPREENRLHDATQPVEQVGRAEKQVGGDGRYRHVPVDPRGSALLPACPCEGEQECDRDAREFEDAGDHVHVLLKGKTETPFHGPAARVDFIGAHLRGQAANGSCGSEGHHGKPVPPATGDRPASRCQECP
jgi:hypothetical protein